jgi:hypothetical protein
VTLVALGACMPQRGLPSASGVTGGWALVSVNNVRLPYLVDQTSTTKTDLLSSIFDFDAHGRCITTTAVRLTINGSATTVTQTDTSTYSLSGPTVTITSRKNAARLTLESGALVGADPATHRILRFERR